MSWQFWIVFGIGAVIFLSLFKKYMNGGTCRLSPNLQYKVAIVTGSNCGIGYYTALRLAELGARVVLACRDPTRANIALEKIKKEVKNAQVEFIRIDLTSTSSIKAFVDAFKSKYDRLDILINNAGLLSETRTVTPEGIETTFAANHLGHFMLTLLLQDYLVKSAPSRVINVSSLASLSGNIHWDDLMLEKGYTMWKAYSQSKLANVIFANEFNRRFESKGVKAVSLHPGSVRTEIGRAYKKLIFKVLIAFLYPLLLLIVKNAKQGAQTTLHCALLDHDQLEGGAYYSDCVVAKMHSHGRDEAVGKRLWDKSLELLKMKDIN